MYEWIKGVCVNVRDNLSMNCKYGSVRVVRGSEPVSDDRGVPGRRALHPTLYVRACAKGNVCMCVCMYVRTYQIIISNGWRNEACCMSFHRGVYMYEYRCLFSVYTCACIHCMYVCMYVPKQAYAVCFWCWNVCMPAPWYFFSTDATNDHYIHTWSQYIIWCIHTFI